LLPAAECVSIGVMPSEESASRVAATRAIAPFERPRGHRGARGLVAALVAVGAVVVLGLSNTPWRGSTGDSGGSGNACLGIACRGTSGPELSWSYQTTSSQEGLDAKVGMWALAVLLLTTAVVLWRARSRRWTMIATIAAAAGIGGSGAIVLATLAHASPSPAAFNSLRLGMSRGQVVGRLGTPLRASAGASWTGHRTMPCIVYPVGTVQQFQRRVQVNTRHDGVPGVLETGSGGSDGGVTGSRSEEEVTDASSYVLLCFTNSRLAVKVPL
jgi:hypothetical protein